MPLQLADIHFRIRFVFTGISFLHRYFFITILAECRACDEGKEYKRQQAPVSVYGRRCISRRLEVTASFRVRTGRGTLQKDGATNRSSARGNSTPPFRFLP